MNVVKGVASCPSDYYFEVARLRLKMIVNGSIGNLHKMTNMGKVTEEKDQSRRIK